MTSRARPPVTISRAACEAGGTREVRYTVATLVNDAAHYDAMLTTFRNGGFSTDDCEYLYIDNTGAGQVDAFRGLNALLDAARGPYVILCHQDVRLLTDGRDTLDARLAELDALDPDWALAGNAGGVAPGELAIRITDPHGANRSVGSLPARVMSLDENFIVVRRDARLSFSRDLEGFHFYGADICLVADILGWSAYVVDFHLIHLSAGNKNTLFEDMEVKFRSKWSKALAPRWMQTTCALVRLAGTPLGQFAGRLAEAPYRKISRRLPNAAGWTRTITPIARS
ncbi:MAG: hypothetical protein AB1749_14835 [Pseudomonadota bacterium]